MIPYPYTSTKISEQFGIQRSLAPVCRPSPPERWLRVRAPRDVDPGGWKCESGKENAVALEEKEETLHFFNVSGWWFETL